MSVQIPSLRSVPPQPPYKKGDVLVVFGELFARGYANGIVDEATAAGLKVIYSTVGRRDENNQLRALNEEELAKQPPTFINIPLEAGFDMETASNGKSPVDQLHGVKMSEWSQAKLDWQAVEESRKKGVDRFKKNVGIYMEKLMPMIPPGSNVIFAHIMAGGVPRTKIIMPTMNRVFKGQGDRHLSSEQLFASDLGKFSLMNFEEVTANTLTHLIELSSQVRTQIEKDGGTVRYLAYGYHGTEVLHGGQYNWQTYTPYFQGWAKMKLEDVARNAQANGISAAVYNCPEILTNSSSIFQGVEVSLYPLMAALQKEVPQSQRAREILAKCKALLKDEYTLEDVQKFIEGYLSNPLMKEFNNDFARWPRHNTKEEMELMLQSSDHLIEMHKDPKQLITFLLSEEVFKATGLLMFRDSFKPQAPVVWLNHDVLAKVIAHNLH